MPFAYSRMQASGSDSVCLCNPDKAVCDSEYGIDPIYFRALPANITGKLKLADVATVNQHDSPMEYLMSHKIPSNPRVLVVTPEVAYLPHAMGNIADYVGAKAGGLADVSAALISALFEQGADVHVAVPEYRALYNPRLPQSLKRGAHSIRSMLPEERIHLAQDRSFFYLDHVYSSFDWENTKIAIAFQREVINNVIPAVQPDLIHCNDWMTGLIPAIARQAGIPCLFTIHNIYTVSCALSALEDRGIDAAEFWQDLYFEWPPTSYEAIRDTYPVDFLASGIFAAHFVNTVSPTFLLEVAQGRHDFVPRHIQQELANKIQADCAVGILNAPDPACNPVHDPHIQHHYGPDGHDAGKRKNKQVLQQQFGLINDDGAPLFFWPSRLDHVQKGCQLLADILYAVVSRYWEQDLEIVFVADGGFKKHFEDIVRFHGLEARVAVCDYDENMAHLAYAAADFVMMPSLFEPCGLPQMIAPVYGALPIAHDTGGIHDTVRHLDVARNTGNGFLFRDYDSNGLSWAIDQAMDFYSLPTAVKKQHIERVMRQSATEFSYTASARRYMDIYEKMLQRPLIHRKSAKLQSVFQNKVNKSALSGLEGIRHRQAKFMRDALYRLMKSALKNIWNKKEARNADHRG
jgi:starch synthase